MLLLSVAHGVSRWLLWCCNGVARCCYGVARCCYGVAMVVAMVLLWCC